MRIHHAARSFRAWLPLAVATLGTVLFALTVLVMAPGTAELAVADGGVAAAATLCTLLYFRAWRRLRGPDRLGMGVLAAGLGTWAAAEWVWFSLDIIFKIDPFPSVADILYVGGVAPIAGGWALIAAARRSAARVWVSLDAVAFALGSAALLWHFFVLPTIRTNEGTLTAQVLSVAYPISDILFVCAAIAVAYRLDIRRHAVLIATVTVGIGAFVAADIGFFFAEAGGGYSPGLIDAGWLGGYLVLAAASQMLVRSSEAGADAELRPNPIMQQVVPLVWVVAMVGFLFTIDIHGEMLADPVGIVLATAAIAVVLVREVFLLRDHTILNRRYDRLRQQLERRVAERTSELTRLVSILDKTPDIVATLDTSGQLQYLNRSGRKLLGLEGTASLEGRHVMSYLPEWARRKVRAEGAPQAMAYGSWEGELALRNSEGRDVPVLQTMLAHHAEGGQVEFLSVIARDISERKSYESHLNHLANHDSLTGVYNRRRFLEELSRELATAHEQRPLAVGYIDLDNFKAVNDALGHRSGDDLLIAITGVMRSVLRPGDVLARLGGDEFAVLCPRTDAAEATHVVEGMLKAVRELLLVLRGKPVRITASAGLVVAPLHGVDPSELLGRADMAMYRSKVLRDRVAVYEPGRDSEAAAEHDRMIEVELREALASGRLRLYAQPIAALGGRRNGQFEVLLRIGRPDGTVVPPAEYLAIAERSGLIREIDRWVVSETIRFLQANGEQAQHLTLHVNLSAVAVSDESLVGEIIEWTKAGGINPGQIVFEITETAAVTNIINACSFIQALKAGGFRFALDDFGVGYSSISHLKHLDVDFIKIDGSFITNLAHDERDRHMVRAVVELARGLSKETVAEYVGDEPTMRELREIGIDYVQGYYLGRPAPIAGTLGKGRQEKVA